MMLRISSPEALRTMAVTFAALPSWNVAVKESSCPSPFGENERGPPCALNDGAASAGKALTIHSGRATTRAKTIAQRALRVRITPRFAVCTARLRRSRYLHAQHHRRRKTTRKDEHEATRGMAAALPIFAVMTPLTACSNQGPSPDSADIPTVAINGASVIMQKSDNPPYVTMTLTTSNSDRLKSAAVDRKVAQKVILTAPTAVTPPKPGEKASRSVRANQSTPFP